MTTSVDQGYSWVALAVLCFTYMTVAGFCKSFGILYAELLVYYEGGSGNTAWISSTSFFLLYLIGPFANHLCTVYTVRRVMMLGGFLGALGMFLSSFVTRMQHWYFTYGIITGLGYGLLFSPCRTVVNYYFDRRRALANGVLVGGSGVGAFIFPYLYRALIDSYNLQGAILIISGFFLNVSVAAALLRQPEIMKRSIEVNKKNQDSENGIALLNENGKSVKTTTKQPSKCSIILRHLRSMLDFSLFKNISFTLYTIGFGVHIFGHSANFAIIPAHIAKLGYSNQEIAIAVSLIGVCEILSRPIFGWFADLKLFNRKYIIVFCVFFSGTAAMIVPFFTEYYLILMYACVVGIFPGALSSLMSIVILDAVTMAKFSRAMGMISFCLSVAVCTGKPIAGWMEDASDTWKNSFRLVGTANFLTGIIFLIESCVKHPKTDEDNEMKPADPEKEPVENFTQTSQTIYNSDIDESNFNSDHSISSQEKSLKAPLVSLHEL